MSSSPPASDQMKVILGIIASWVVAAAFYTATFLILLETRWLSSAEPQTLFSLSLTFSAAPLAFGIGWAARTRHFEQDIDGAAPASGSPLDLTLRFVQNTVEQTVLFVIALFSFYTNAADYAMMLPVMAIWFVVARIAFWIGYRRENSVHRAFGFAGTFHTTIVILTISILASFEWFPALNLN